MKRLFMKNKALKPVPTNLVAGNRQISFRVFSPALSAFYSAIHHLLSENVLLFWELLKFRRMILS